MSKKKSFNLDHEFFDEFFDEKKDSIPTLTISNENKPLYQQLFPQPEAFKKELEKYINKNITEFKETNGKQTYALSIISLYIADKLGIASNNKSYFNQVVVNKGLPQPNYSVSLNKEGSNENIEYIIEKAAKKDHTESRNNVCASMKATKKMSKQTIKELQQEENYEHLENALLYNKLLPLLFETKPHEYFGTKKNSKQAYHIQIPEVLQIYTPDKDE
jgi:hypothetical protein